MPGSFSARVCVHCTGPRVVSPEGHAVAMVSLTIRATAPIDGLRLDAIEVFDADGRAIGATPRGDLVTSSASPPRPRTTFDGRLAPGDEIELWTTATLDQEDEAVRARPPVRFELRLVGEGGLVVDRTGSMAPSGATG